MNPEQSVIFHLGYLTKIVNNKANTLFHEAGLNVRVEQIPVLIAIYCQGPLSQQELANILSRDKSSIQRTIVTLSRNQLVSIGNDRLDKRKNIISLTEYGKQLTSMLEKSMIEVEHLLFDHISDWDRQKLIGIIKKFVSGTVLDDNNRKQLIIHHHKSLENEV